MLRRSKSCGISDKARRTIIAAHPPAPIPDKVLDVMTRSDECAKVHRMLPISKTSVETR